MSSASAPTARGGLYGRPGTSGLFSASMSALPMPDWDGDIALPRSGSMACEPGTKKLTAALPASNGLPAIRFPTTWLGFMAHDIAAEKGDWANWYFGPGCATA